MITWDKIQLTTINNYNVWYDAADDGDDDEDNIKRFLKQTLSFFEI